MSGRKSGFFKYERSDFDLTYDDYSSDEDGESFATPSQSKHLLCFDFTCLIEDAKEKSNKKIQSEVSNRSENNHRTQKIIEIIDFDDYRNEKKVQSSDNKYEYDEEFDSKFDSSLSEESFGTHSTDIVLAGDKDSVECSSGIYSRLSVLGPEKHASIVLIPKDLDFPVILLLTSSRNLMVIPIIFELIEKQNYVTLDSWSICSKLTQEMNKCFILNGYFELYFDAMANNDPTLCNTIGQECMNILLRWFMTSNSHNTVQNCQFSRVLEDVFASLRLTVGHPEKSKSIFHSWLINQVPIAASVQSESNEVFIHAEDVNCLICFDPIHSGSSMSHLSPCKHPVCRSCWRSYILSNTKSGYDDRIRCPGEKCTASIDLFDAAHILFSTSESSVHNVHQSKEIFDGLLSNTLQLYCVSKLNSCYCPSKGCSRFLPSLKVVRNGHVGPGWNILKCSCGAMVCADCPPSCSKQAHPGISCSDFKLIRDRIESDLESITWLMQNSRPCPRCTKFDGCNHVRCTKCDMYFCWNCGGPGIECGSYTCRNMKRDNMDSQCYKDLSRKAIAFRDYHKTEFKLRSMERQIIAIKSESNRSIDRQLECDDLLLGRQILIVIHWLSSFACSKDNFSNVTEISSALQRMKNLFFMFQARKLYRGHSMSLEEIVKLIQAEMENAENLHKRKGHTGSQTTDTEYDTFDTYMTALQFKDMMNEDNVAAIVIREIKSSLEYLAPRPVMPSKASRRRKDKTVPIAPNNCKMGKKEPWKKGFRLENKETLAEERLIKKVSRWKK